MNGVSGIRGTGCSAKSGVVPRNQVRLHLSHDQTQPHLVLGMEAYGLLSWRESEGFRGRVLGKDLEGWVELQLSPWSYILPIFPTCQMGIIFLAALPINGMIDVGTFKKKNTTEL